MKNLAISFLVLLVSFGVKAFDESATGCPTIEVTGRAVSCFGQSDGEATVTITSGTGPYTISWGTSPVTFGNTISGLQAGTYTVVVKDIETEASESDA